MAKKFNGNIKLASAICRTGAQPLDDSTVVSTVDDLYAFSEALYEGMMVVVNADHSIYVLTDVSKVGQADGWKKIGDVSGDITNLQTQITANKTAAETAQATAEAAQTQANKAITGIGSDGGILMISGTLDSNKKEISAFINMSYDSTSKKLNLYGTNLITPISSVDCTDFVKDGMLKGSALYKATAATGTVTIGGEEYSLSGLTSGKTYIVLVWNADADTDPMTIDVTDLIDVYTASGDDYVTASASGNNIAVAASDALKSAVKKANNSVQYYAQGAAQISSLTIGAHLILDDPEGSEGGVHITIDENGGEYLSVNLSEDNKYYDSDGYVALAGVRTPETDYEAANKQYVDSSIAAIDSGVTTLGGQKGAITVDSGKTATGDVNFTLGTDKKLTAKVAGLGTAAAKNIADFATAAQGVKADNSVQYEENGKDVVLPEDSNLTVYTKITSKAGVLQLGADAQTAYDIVIHSTEDDEGNAAIKFSESGNAVVLQGVHSPVADNDAANKSYVDTKVSSAVSSAMAWAGWN